MKLIPICVLLLLVPASAFAQTDFQKKQISDAIRKVMIDQTEAWNRGDIGSFMEGYWKSKDLVFVSGDNITLGWQPTLDRYKKNYDTREKMGILKFSDLEITVLSGQAAVVLGSWELKR